MRVGKNVSVRDEDCVEQYLAGALVDRQGWDEEPPGTRHQVSLLVE